MFTKIFKLTCYSFLSIIFATNPCIAENTNSISTNTSVDLVSNDKSPACNLPSKELNQFRTENKQINADYRALYIGFEGGISVPIINQIKHSSTLIHLKSSQMYTGKIGYDFYPGMSLEFSATMQPKYKVNCTIPNITKGSTKFKTQVYMLNLVYNFEPIATGLTPYVVGGFGIAKLHILPKQLKYNNKSVFKILDKKQTSKSWQIGLGLTKEITPNFFIDLSAKMQVLSRVKLHYSVLDSNGRFITPTPITTRAALGEYGIGFIFKIPL